jgi:hypothetical protein
MEGKMNNRSYTIEFLGFRTLQQGQWMLKKSGKGRCTVGGVPNFFVSRAEAEAVGEEWVKNG